MRLPRVPGRLPPTPGSRVHFMRALRALTTATPHAAAAAQTAMQSECKPQENPAASTTENAQ
jgi:hypothetical protein